MSLIIKSNIPNSLPLSAFHIGQPLRVLFPQAIITTTPFSPVFSCLLPEGLHIKITKYKTTDINIWIQNFKKIMISEMRLNFTITQKFLICLYIYMMFISYQINGKDMTIKSFIFVNIKLTN